MDNLEPTNEERIPAEAPKKQGRGHFFCEKAPLLVMLVGAVFLTIFYPLLGTIARGLLMLAVPSLDPKITEYLLIAASSIVFLGVFKWWFSPDYEGSFPLHVPLGDAIRWTVPLWIFLGLCVVLEGVMNGFFFRIDFNIIAMCLYAGFFEESIFRIFMVAIGMRYLSGEKRVWWAVILSSVLFGLFHAGNILGGAPVETTIHQVINSVLFGIFMAALVLRTGSVLPSAISHTLYDIIAMVTTPGIMDGVMHTTPDMTSYIELALVLIPAYVGYRMIREHKAEILAIWEEKWSMTPAKEEAESV